MTTTYTWAIAQLERNTADGIVFTVHWTLSANDGTYASSAYGSIGLEQPEDNVIPLRRPDPRDRHRLGAGQAGRARRPGRTTGATG